MALSVEVTPDAAAALRAAGAWLRAHRVEATVPAQVLHRAALAPRPDGPRVALVRDGKAVVGLAVVTAAYPVALGPMPGAAATALAARLVDDGPVPDGVSGPVGACEAFAARVRARTGREGHVVMREGVLVLGDVVRPRGVTGSARLARPDEAALVHAWLEDFVAEAVPGDPVPPRDAVAARVASGAWLLWTDEAGRPVSAAHLHAAVLGVARIGPVWTPPEHRRNGFAAALTAAACCRLLAGGADDVVLLTDLANPTSNRVYERVGFRRVAEAVLLRFAQA